MALLVRLIWRFDYALNFDFIDNRGRALRILTDGDPEYWTSINETNNNGFQCDVEHDDGVSMRVSMDRNNVSGYLVWRRGRKLEDCLRDELFVKSNRVVNDLLKAFEIDDFVRGGIRFLYAENANSTSRALNSNAFVWKGAVEETLGPIDDFALTAEGKSADELNYRLSLGPLRRKNLDNLVGEEATEEEWELFAKYSTLVDLDLYELKFNSMAGLYRWSQTKLEKALILNKSVRAY